MVENYPGAEPMLGMQLMQKFYKQAQSFGAEFLFEEVVSLEKKDDLFSVKMIMAVKEDRYMVLDHQRMNRFSPSRFFRRGLPKISLKVWAESEFGIKLKLMNSTRIFKDFKFKILRISDF